METKNIERHPKGIEIGLIKMEEENELAEEKEKGTWLVEDREPKISGLKSSILIHTLK